MADYEEYPTKKAGKQHNTLPLWGNEASMNLNPLILTNIQGSSYFKVHLFKLKTYHEVVDEIYYHVKHLEPWERGSRKTSGQTGMCGGVRGVGAGGIVSTAYCLLYKLYTLRLTRKQVNGLLNHTDSPYIRGLGLMYLRYTQPPGDLYDWYEDYLEDEEEIDVKADGGQITIGQMAFQLLTKLDWFSTLFPRIPVPIQKQIEKKLDDYSRLHKVNFQQANNQRQNQYGRETGGNHSRSVDPYAALPPRVVEVSHRDRADPYAAHAPRERDSHSDRDSSYKRRDNRDDGRDYYASNSSSSHRDDRDYPKREDRHSRNRSPSRDGYERKEKHKKKHKHKDRSRSRDRSAERHRERDYDRRYR